MYLAVGQDGQPYAVKLFPASLAAHAEREWQCGHDLQHPCLIRVLARSEVQGQPALVLTFARGQVLLARYAGEGPALIRERPAYLRTLTHALGALAHLHGRGLIHRDVKPDNLLVEPDGSARLVDFDLSGRPGEDFGAATRIGTPAYLSPEAQRGEVQGPASDLWGIGLLLYWGLHAELPSTGLAGTPLRASPDPLAPLMRALLHPDWRQRPDDAGAVLAELRQIEGLSTEESGV